MKKLFAVAAALVLAGNAVFAGDFYNGDIQIQLGVGFDKVTASVDATNTDFDPIKATVFDFGFETWHLFKPIDMLGVGFNLGLNGGVGLTDKWSYTVLGEKISGNENGFSANFNFNIGPAVGLYLGNVVRLGLSFGLDVGYNLDEPFVYKVDTDYYSGRNSVEADSGFVGFDVGVQAKFVPNSFINPVLGWRLVRGTSDSYNVNTSGNGIGSSSKTVNGNYVFTQNVIYLALAFSW